MCLHVSCMFVNFFYNCYRVGVFTLTQPHGLSYISKCSGKGFHTHPKEPPIYEVRKNSWRTYTCTCTIDEHMVVHLGTEPYTCTFKGSRQCSSGLYFFGYKL